MGKTSRNQDRSLLISLGGEGKGSGTSYSIDMASSQKVLTFGLLAILSLPPLPTTQAGTAGKGPERCGAISIKDRPRVGDRTNGFDWHPFMRAHDRYLRRHPHVFASGYLSGKHFYVGFTRRVCHHLRRIRRMVEQRWRFQAFVANYSWRQLRRAQWCVRGLAHRKRLGLSAWGPDVWRNKLWVMLRKRTERRERVIRRECPKVPIVFTEGQF